MAMMSHRSIMLTVMLMKLVFVNDACSCRRAMLLLAESAVIGKTKVAKTGQKEEKSKCQVTHMREEDGRCGVACSKLQERLI